MFDTIKLEKGMYGVCGKNFTNILEDLDPSENYKGTTFEGLDAYQRQLKRFDIKVSGSNCDTVEKFFSATDSAVLFPEFIARSIKQGISSSGFLDDVVAARSKISGNDFRKLNIATSTSENVDVSEGSDMRTVTVKNNSTAVALKKHGRVLSTSYEVLRGQNLDVLSVILKQVGKDIADEFLKDAVTELQSTGTISVDSGGSGTLSYTDLLSVMEMLGNYKLTTIIGTQTTLSTLLNLSEIKNSATITSSVETGEIKPLGAKLIPSSNGGTKLLTCFDKNFALQMIQGNDIVVDYDKLISSQFEKIGISVSAGFGKIYSNAIKILDYNA